MSIESVMPSSHLILCRPLLLLSPIPPSIRVFSNESALCMRLPKYWSFSFSISPSNEHPGLISFKMVWLDLLVVQGTLKSLLQHHSSKASILQCSAFFTVQLSHPYMTNRIILLVLWTAHSLVKWKKPFVREVTWTWLAVRALHLTQGFTNLCVCACVCFYMLCFQSVTEFDSKESKEGVMKCYQSCLFLL